MARSDDAHQPKITSLWRRIPVIAVASILGLLAAGLLITLYSEQTYRAEKLAEAQSQARVLAASVTAALAFDDRSAAREYLDALGANTQVSLAAVYDESGALAVSYIRGGAETPPSTAPAPGALSRNGHLIVVAPVVQGSTRLGSVFLQTDAEPFARRLMRFGWVALLALMGSVVAGVLAVAHATLRRANAELETKAADLVEIAARQRAILNSAMDAIVTLSPDGSIEMINRAGERMFGYPAEQLVRRDVEVLVDVGSPQSGSLLKRLGVAEDAAAGGLVKELTGRRIDGTRFPADLALGAMELPDGLHLVAMIRDISDRKRAERLKDEFVSTVSHELRTPLTSIAGSLGLLSGGAAGPLPSKAERLTQIAHANCERLIRLINDILDIQKIESGALRFDMTPVRLGQLVSRSIEGIRGYANDLGVQMIFEARYDPAIHGDADRMIQVVTNLLSNAIKFSPVGETVEVSLERKGKMGRLSIRDRGPGVPESFRDRIFSKFAQGDSTDTRQKGGTGLGLAISKEIVERHGGRLWFESWTGRGAVFHVDLPLLAAEARPAGDPDAPRLQEKA